jgi:hypothetical protein
MMKRSWINSAKPICIACHRPFDPSSPGATPTMGPTCARRSGHLAVDEVGDLQLTFGNDQVAKLAPLKAKTKLPTVKSSTKIPRSLAEKFVEAKLAFDELFREFFIDQNVLYGEAALIGHQTLMENGAEDHSFNDPILNWLEPEHELHLVLDPCENKAYCWRILNGTYTLLKLDPRSSVAARRNVSVIRAFSLAVTSYRHAQDVRQLSLVGID